MPKDVIGETIYWADIGDNRVGPLLRELIEALADSDDPHFVRSVAQRITRLSSSLNSMAHRMAETHDRKNCEICKRGSVL